MIGIQGLGFGYQGFRRIGGLHGVWDSGFRVWVSGLSANRRPSQSLGLRVWVLLRFTTLCVRRSSEDVRCKGDGLENFQGGHNLVEVEDEVELADVAKITVEHLHKLVYHF
jgi:hypothetical protein